MFFFGKKSKIGVDIGTSSIKIAQLKKEAETFELETYGIVNVAYQRAIRLEGDVIAETAEVLKKLISKSLVTTRKVVASLPNNIVFISVIEIPNMSEKELKGAIEWEAKRYVPLPLEEVTLAWSVLGSPRAASGQLKVLLTAVPTNVIDNYLKMFKLAELEPVALEIEALALIRSLGGSRKDSFILIDIGARTTSLNLVDQGFLKVSRNLAVGGETITSAIAKGLHISFSRAEQFKKDLGLGGNSQQIPQAIRPILDTIKNEIAQLIKLYESGGGVIQEMIFSGSGSRLYSLLNYFSDFGFRTILGNPLQFVKYDPKLQKNLNEVSLSLAVALGLAMRE